MKHIPKAEFYPKFLAVCRHFGLDPKPVWNLMHNRRGGINPVAVRAYLTIYGTMR